MSEERSEETEKEESNAGQKTKMVYVAIIIGIIASGLTSFVVKINGTLFEIGKQINGSH